MGVYDHPIATARRLIEKYGQECVWQKAAADDDSDEPWRDVREGEPTNHDVRIAWFPPGSNLAFLAALAGTEVPTNAESGLMAGDVPFEPLASDIVFKGDDPETGQRVEITKIDRLAPNGTPVLYTIWVAR